MKELVKSVTRPVRVPKTIDETVEIILDENDAEWFDKMMWVDYAFGVTEFRGTRSLLKYHVLNRSGDLVKYRIEYGKYWVAIDHKNGNKLDFRKNNLVIRKHGRKLLGVKPLAVNVELKPRAEERIIDLA